MQKIQGKPAKLLAILIAASLALGMLPAVTMPVSAAGEQYQTLTVSDGYNVDLIAEAKPAKTTTNAPFDSADDQDNNVLYSEDYNANGGLPRDGKIISISDPPVAYQLAPYDGNNALRLDMKNKDDNSHIGTLTFSTLGAYSRVSVLGASASGAAWVNLTINYSDGSTSSQKFGSKEWFFVNTDIAFSALGRVDREQTRPIQTSGPRLYQYQVDTDPTKLITGITFTESAMTAAEDGGNYTNNPSGDKGSRPGGSTTVVLLAVSGVVSANAPATPEKPTTGVVGGDNFTMQWPAVDGVTTYAVDVSENPSFIPMLEGYNNKQVGETSCHVTGLSPETTYYYRVRAVDETYGQSWSSETASVKTTVMPVDYTLTFDKASGKFTDGTNPLDPQPTGITVEGNAQDGFVLTLDDFRFATTLPVALQVPDGTEIILEGDNDIISLYHKTTDGEDTIGILAGESTTKPGSLVISGDGALTARGGVTSEGSAGIIAKNLTVQEASVTGIGGTGIESVGVLAMGVLTVSDGAKVYGESTSTDTGENTISAGVGVTSTSVTGTGSALSGKGKVYGIFIDGNAMPENVLADGTTDGSTEQLQEASYQYDDQKRIGTYKIGDSIAQYISITPLMDATLYLNEGKLYTTRTGNGPYEYDNEYTDDKNVTWTADGNTLTLKEGFAYVTTAENALVLPQDATLKAEGDAAIETVFSGSAISSSGIWGDSSLTIEVAEGKTLAVASGSPAGGVSYGIRISGGTLNVKGKGTLAASCGKASTNAGITTGSLSIAATTVKAVADHDGMSGNGLIVSGTISLTGGGKLHAAGQYHAVHSLNENLLASMLESYVIQGSKSKTDIADLTPVDGVNEDKKGFTIGDDAALYVEISEIPPPEYTLTVDSDGKVTDGANEVTVPGLTAVKNEDGTFTVTMEDVDFITTSPAVLSVPDGTTIVLKGENTLTGGDDENEDSYGIICAGALTIQSAQDEDGILNINSGEGSFSYAIFTDEDLIIDGAAVNATGGDSTEGNSNGLCVMGNLELKGGAAVTAESSGAENMSNSVYCGGDVTIDATSSLAATAGIGKTSSSALYLSGALDNAGTLTAQGGNYGIYSDDADADHSITGTVTAQGSTAALYFKAEPTLTGVGAKGGADDSQALDLHYDETADYYYAVPGTAAKYAEIAFRGTVPTITIASLPGGYAGVPYSQTLTADGDAPVTWTIVDGSGSLPGGLTLSAATGVISGTPKQAGTSSFTVMASNSAGDDTAALSITITTIYIPEPDPDPDPVTSDPVDDKKTETVADTGITVSGDQKIVTNDDGSLSLPVGGTLNINDEVSFDAPAGTVIAPDGTVAIPADKTAELELAESGAAITVPGGTTVATDGEITVGNGEAVLLLPNESEITLPQGSTITGKTVTVGPGGATVAAGDETVTLEEGAILILDDDVPLGYYILFQNPFDDVSEDDWFYDAVKYVYEKGIMQGTGEDSFAPGVKLNRAMMVQILFNLEGASAEGSAGYDDVPDGQWYSEAVAWGTANGIVDGIGNNLFAPLQDVTREQMAVMLYRYCVYKQIQLPAQRTGSFQDADAVGLWAAQAVDAMYQALVLNGKGNDVFDPRGSAIRAEVAQMMMNFMELIG